MMMPQMTKATRTVTGRGTKKSMAKNTFHESSGMATSSNFTGFDTSSTAMPSYTFSHTNHPRWQHLQTSLGSIHHQQLCLVIRFRTRIIRDGNIFKLHWVRYIINSYA